MSFSGAISPEAWYVIASYDRFPHVGRLIQLGKWFSVCMRQQVKGLALRAPRITGTTMEMIVDSRFAPKSYLQCFRGLERLWLDIFDEKSAMDPPEHTMYYFVVPSAIGVLLEKGAFPNLRSLEILVGVYHAGELVKKTKKKMQEEEKDLWWHGKP